MIRFLEIEIDYLEEKFPEYGFQAGKVGARDDESSLWGSIFVTDSNDIQIGRLLFKDKGDGPKFSHRKAYGENKGFAIDSFWEQYEKEELKNE